MANERNGYSTGFVVFAVALIVAALAALRHRKLHRDKIGVHGPAAGLRGPERRDRTGPHWWMEAHAHYGTAMWNLARGTAAPQEGPPDAVTVPPCIRVLEARSTAVPGLAFSDRKRSGA